MAGALGAEEAAPLLAVHRRLLAQALELAAAVCGTGEDRVGGAEEGRAAVERVREAGAGVVDGAEMAAAERAAVALARAQAAVASRRAVEEELRGSGGKSPPRGGKDRAGGEAGCDGSAGGDDPSVAAVLAMPELMEAIAGKIGQGDVLAFSLTGRAFLAGVRGAGRELRSPVMETAMVSEARARWLLPERPKYRMDWHDPRVCAAAARSGELSALEVARSHGFALSHKVLEEACLTLGEGYLPVLEWAEEHGLNIMHLNPQEQAEVFVAAARGGNSDAMRWLSRRGLAGVLHSYWGALVAAAAAGAGQLSALRWLMERGCMCNFQVFASAAEGGHFEILKWARSQGLSFENHDDDLSEGTAAAAAKSGRLDIIIWAIEEGCAYDWHVYLRAAGSGHLPILEWAFNMGLAFVDRDVLVLAAAEGKHYHVVAWLLERGCGWGACTELLFQCARDGELEALQQLLRLGCPWGLNGKLVCRVTAYNGHLDILRFLRKQVPPCPWYVRAGTFASGRMSQVACKCRGSVHADYLDRWLTLCGSAACELCGTAMAPEGEYERENGAPGHWEDDEGPVLPRDPTICEAAADLGDLAMLQWVRSQDPPCPWDKGTCQRAAESGNLEILQWARGQDPPCPWDASVLYRARACGHEEVVAWALANGCEESA